MVPPVDHRIYLCYRKSDVEHFMISFMKGKLIRRGCKVVDSIVNSTTVLVLLTPGVFEFIDYPDDNIRSELSYVLTGPDNFNIITIKCDLFIWPDMEHLPAELRPLRFKDSIEWSSENRDGFMSQLVAKIGSDIPDFLSPPIVDMEGPQWNRNDHKQPTQLTESPIDSAESGGQLHRQGSAFYFDDLSQHVERKSKAAMAEKAFSNPRAKNDDTDYRLRRASGTQSLNSNSATSDGELNTSRSGSRTATIKGNRSGRSSIYVPPPTPPSIYHSALSLAGDVTDGTVQSLQSAVVFDNEPNKIHQNAAPAGELFAVDQTGTSTIVFDQNTPDSESEKSMRSFDKTVDSDQSRDENNAKITEESEQSSDNEASRTTSVNPDQIDTEPKAKLRTESKRSPDQEASGTSTIVLDQNQDRSKDKSERQIRDESVTATTVTLPEQAESSRLNRPQDLSADAEDVLRSTRSNSFSGNFPTIKKDPAKQKWRKRSFGGIMRRKTYELPKELQFGKYPSEHPFWNEGKYTKIPMHDEFVDEHDKPSRSFITRISNRFSRRKNRSPKRQLNNSEEQHEKHTKLVSDPVVVSEIIEQRTERAASVRMIKEAEVHHYIPDEGETKTPDLLKEEEEALVENAGSTPKERRKSFMHEPDTYASPNPPMIPNELVAAEEQEAILDLSSETETEASSMGYKPPPPPLHVEESPEHEIVNLLPPQRVLSMNKAQVNEVPIEEITSYEDMDVYEQVLIAPRRVEKYHQPNEVKVSVPEIRRAATYGQVNVDPTRRKTLPIPEMRRHEPVNRVRTAYGNYYAPVQETNFALPLHEQRSRKAPPVPGWNQRTLAPDTDTYQPPPSPEEIRSLDPKALDQNTELSIENLKNIQPVAKLRKSLRDSETKHQETEVNYVTYKLDPVVHRYDEPPEYSSLPVPARESIGDSADASEPVEQCGIRPSKDVLTKENNTYRKSRSPNETRSEIIEVIPPKPPKARIDVEKEEIPSVKRENSERPATPEIFQSKKKPVYSPPLKPDRDEREPVDRRLPVEHNIDTRTIDRNLVLPSQYFIEERYLNEPQMYRRPLNPEVMRTDFVEEVKTPTPLSYYEIDALQVDSRTKGSTGNEQRDHENHRYVTDDSQENESRNQSWKNEAPVRKHASSSLNPNRPVHDQETNGSEADYEYVIKKEPKAHVSHPIPREFVFDDATDEIHRRPVVKPVWSTDFTAAEKSLELSEGTGPMTPRNSLSDARPITNVETVELGRPLGIRRVQTPIPIHDRSSTEDERSSTPEYYRPPTPNGLYRQKSLRKNQDDRRTQSTIDLQPRMEAARSRKNSLDSRLTPELLEFIRNHKHEPVCYQLVCPRGLANNLDKVHFVDEVQSLTNLDILRRRRLSYLLAIDACQRNQEIQARAYERSKTPDSGCDAYSKVSGGESDFESEQHLFMVAKELEKIHKRQQKKRLPMSNEDPLVERKSSADPAQSSSDERASQTPDSYRAPAPPYIDSYRSPPAPNDEDSDSAPVAPHGSYQGPNSPTSYVSYHAPNAPRENPKNESGSYSPPTAYEEQNSYRTPSVHSNQDTYRPPAVPETYQNHPNGRQALKESIEGKTVFQPYQTSGSSSSETTEALDTWRRIWTDENSDNIPRLTQGEIASLNGVMKNILLHQNSLTAIRQSLRDFISKHGIGFN